MNKMNEGRFKRPSLYFGRCDIAFLAHAANVAAVAGVNLDDLVGVDEQGHANSGASLDGGGLESVGSGIAFHAGLSVSDLELGLDGHLGKEHGLGRSVADNFNDIAFLHIVGASDKVLVDRNLLKSLVIHEHGIVAIHVEVLIGATLNAHVLELLTDIEAALQHASINDVFKFGAHKGVTLTGLYMQEFDTEIQIAIQADAGSVLDVLSINHNCSAIIIFYVNIVCSQSFESAKLVILRKKAKSFLQKCIWICVF